LGKRYRFWHLPYPSFFLYFLPVNTILKKMAGFSIFGMGIVKIVLGIFIIWAAVGVGELYDR
jgi:hypothetical protein